jgi:hypothetical protein
MKYSEYYYHVSKHIQTLGGQFYYTYAFIKAVFFGASLAA